jgi:ribosomal protein S18 acetylase RimI-like enzyme
MFQGAQFMENILQDFSPDRLAIANEENLASWIPVFGRLKGGRLDDIPGITRATSNIPMSLLNSIMDARLSPEQVPPTIERIIADARLRKVPVLWWIGPSTRPADLASQLINYGFSIDEDGPGMAADLENLNESLPAPVGLSIQPSQDDDAWWAWSRTMARGFGAPSARFEFAVNTWHNLLSELNPTTAQAYTAWLDGTPVATSLLLLGGGVAGIYSVATIPEARCKGIGAQVTLYPLHQARQMGYKVGVLQSSEMGLSMYKSLGFQECCRITSYVWRPNVK